MTVDQDRFAALVNAGIPIAAARELADSAKYSNPDTTTSLIIAADRAPVDQSSDPGTTGQFMVDSAATTTGTFKVRFVVPSGPQAGTHDTTALTPDNSGGYAEDYVAAINAAVGGAGNLANLVTDYGIFQYDFAEDLAFMAVVVSIIDDTTDPSVALFNNIPGVDPSEEPGDIAEEGTIWSDYDAGAIYQRKDGEWGDPTPIGGQV